MNDEKIYYFTKDHGHDYDNEIPDSIMYCVLALLGMFSYLCVYFLEHGL